jgi:pyruvate/2-oxoglutarate dehydrogenase complex dihydrolipoamide dehydrogenase (E3) component
MEVNMNTYDYDIGIIGGGAAGLTVASGAAQLGAKTLLIEKEPALGGDCLHYGCVPSKTLIKSAHVYHQIKHAQRYGLPPMQVPPVDFGQIAERIRQVIGVIQKHDSVERFCGLGAKVQFGQALFRDDHTVSVGGKSVTAEKWLIATGSSAAVPPISGLRDVRYLTNRELFSLERLPASIIVLGAGPIGIEMAQAFNRLGSTVTVVDKAEQILAKEDEDMAAAVQQVLAAEGVVFHLGVGIEAVTENHGKKTVTIRKTDGTPIDLTGEQVLVAMGRSANVQDLGLEAAGVAYDRFGVKVDARLRTSRKHIFAAGDAIGGYQFTHAAGYEGGVVVSNAIFRLPRKVNYTWLPWCTYVDPELASIGMNEKAAKQKQINYSVWLEPFRGNDRSLAESQTTGQIKMVLDEKQRPIGVQILGARAGDLIGEWVGALNGGVKLSTIAAAVHPYPTVGEINKKVAGALFSQKIFSDRVRKGLKLFFNLKGRACTAQGESAADGN